MSGTEETRRSEREPKLPEPYESLVELQAQPTGSAPYNESQARLNALLARDLTQAINRFAASTTWLSWVLIGLTIVLVVFGAMQIWPMLRHS